MSSANAFPPSSYKSPRPTRRNTTTPPGAPRKAPLYRELPAFFLDEFSPELLADIDVNSMMMCLGGEESNNKTK